MSQTNYLLDTNVIFNDPYVLNKFENCNIYIPGVVLEELDKHKNNEDLFMQVRIFSHVLDKLYTANNVTEKGCKVIFTVDTFEDADLNYLGGRNNDNVIVHTAKVLNDIEAVTLLSNDMAVRNKARNLSHIEASGMTQELTDNTSQEFYKGYFELFLEDDVINNLYQNNYIPVQYLLDAPKELIKPHAFVILKRYSGSGDVIAKIDGRGLSVETIQPLLDVYGIKPKNAQQIMALHLLLDDDIPLVTLTGKAGSGKTLITLAAALMLVHERDSFYKRITCATPTVDMGKGIGFLPGDKEEKLGPYVQSFYDALEYIFGGTDGLNNALGGMQDEFQIDAINYIRGRSLPNQFFILDEAQNTTKHEIKTIITRMGEKSKIVIMGDPSQIDVPYLDKYNNGLTYAIEKFKDKHLAGHVELVKGERSPLADMAADIL